MKLLTAEEARKLSAPMSEDDDKFAKAIQKVNAKIRRRVKDGHVTALIGFDADTAFFRKLPDWMKSSLEESLRRAGYGVEKTGVCLILINWTSNEQDE